MAPNLIIPSFIAGILTFLAPCTLPLLPGFLGFISGVSLQDLKDPVKAAPAQKKVFLNGVLYVLGFSLVFILMGTLAGLGGSALIRYRPFLSRISGALVIFFGIYLLSSTFNLRFSVFRPLGSQYRLILLKKLRPGHPLGSLAFGAVFAFGWTPCLGPILGSVLTLAASSATVAQGALLLGIYSTGLAIPFLVIAATLDSAITVLNKVFPHLHWIAAAGGFFLIFLGTLMLTNHFADWISFFYTKLNPLKANHLLKFF